MLGRGNFLLLLKFYGFILRNKEVIVICFVVGQSQALGLSMLDQSNESCF